MMYAWSLLLILLSIAMVTADSTTSSLFVSRDQADPNRVVTIEFNLPSGRQLTQEQYRALRQAIVDALNRRRRGSTTTIMESTTTKTSQEITSITSTEAMTVQPTTETTTTTVQETTSSVPETTMTTVAHIPPPVQKRKRNALWVTKRSHYGNGIPSEFDDGVFRISEILNTEDSKLSLDLLMDSMRDMDRTGELQKAIGSPITLVNVYRGLPKVPKPEITQLQRIRRGVSRLREILGI